MRRFVAILATTSLLLSVGCGGKSYEVRLGKTLEEMRYRKRLDDNLMPAPTKGKFNDFQIFVRPPLGLGEPTKEFSMVALEPGKFDVAESFVEPGKLSLYILGRVKRPKDPSKKKTVAPVETATRLDFNTDVFQILNSVYGVEVDAAKAKSESKRLNTFKHVTFESNGKNVQVYLNGNKSAVYEVALIFEYPKTEQASLVSKIDLALGSFATGERARRAFAGSVVEEESGEGATPGAPAVF